MIGMFLQSASAVADVSSVAFLAPILAFLLIVIVMAAILQKTEILGGNIWISLFVSLFVGAVFVSTDALREMLLGIIPWFGVLLIGAFFVLVLVMFVNKDGVPAKFLVWLFLIVMIVVFVIAGFNLYAGSISGYVPGPLYGVDVNPETFLIWDWIYSSPQFVGSFWLIVASIIVGFVLVKFGSG